MNMEVYSLDFYISFKSNISKFSIHELIVKSCIHSCPTELGTLLINELHIAYSIMSCSVGSNSGLWP